MTLHYTLPDATVRLGHEPFALTRTYTRQSTHNWSQQVEVSPETVVPVVAEVRDPETDEIVTPAQPEQIIPARYETVYHSGWLATAAPTDLAALGITVDDVPDPLPSLADAQAARVAALSAEHDRRFEAYIVTVDVGGVSRPYGCDARTRESVLAIVGAIQAAPGLIPNPRPFTPKGQIAPVDTTHAEMIAIYLAGLAAGDAHYTVYATHKATILALTDAAAVLAYDITTGWPGGA